MSSPAGGSPSSAGKAAPLRHRISIRFAATVAFNVVDMGVTFFAMVLIARGLGSHRYGNLSFLIASFAAISPLLDMGSSSAFYTFLSRQKRGMRFFRSYAAWLTLQLGAVLAIVFLSPRSLLDRVWLGQSRALLVVATLAGFCANPLWRCLQQIGESARETVLIQGAGAALAVAHAGLMLLLWVSGRMTVTAVLAAITAEYALVTVWFFIFFPWPSVLDQTRIEPPKRELWAEFMHFSRPLALAGWAGFLYSFADRWLLQRFSGPTEQAYLSIGQQFSAVSLIAAVSFINILWKEAAQAHHNGDQELLGRIFLRSVRLLYFIAAALTCFAIPFSREILPRLLGASYADCWPTFAVLALFPLHQSLGQITGAYFQATGRTRPYMLFAFLLVLISLPLAYWVLSPSTGAMPGLGLGSTGLAVKMVAVQALMINLQGYFLCRESSWRWPFGYQLAVPVALLSLSIVCYGALSVVITNASLAGSVIKAIFGLAIYTSAIAGFVYRFPETIGLDTEKLSEWTAYGRNFARSFINVTRDA